MPNLNVAKITFRRINEDRDRAGGKSLIDRLGTVFIEAELPARGADEVKIKYNSRERLSDS